MGQSRKLEEHSMAPQRVWFKQLSKYIKRIGFIKTLGSVAFCTVLVSQLGGGSMAASPSNLGGSELLAIAMLDSGTLRQSDPDCKYPPCD
jgi:hypothetical protein